MKKSVKVGGLVKLIGKKNLFVIDELNLNLYFQRALDRANELVAQTEEDSGVEEMDAEPVLSGELRNKAVSSCEMVTAPDGAVTQRS